MQKIVTVIGATGSGKSDFAVRLAREFNGEIISADSRQIYKGLDLSTGKITSAEMKGIPHHLIDAVEIGEPYSVYNFKNDAIKAISEIVGRNRLPIICGGTGLYTRAVVEGFELGERASNKELIAELESKSLAELQQMVAEQNIAIVETDVKNKRRLISAIAKHEQNVAAGENAPEFKALQICLSVPRDVLRECIKTRLKARIDAGMLEEIKRILASGADSEFLKTLGLDMKLSVMYLNGEFKTFNEFFETLWIKECQYAKRQQTWFKKEKNCIYVNPLEKGTFETACAAIQKFLSE